MKLLLICQDEQIAGEVFRYFTPLGYSVIHYTNPLKAIDNYREIRPEIVVFNSSDFPRHWKLGVQFLRELFNKETALFILMAGDSFPEEDLHKAHILGVNGILKESKEAPVLLLNMESLILRYKPSPDVRTNRHLMPLGNRAMDFMFMNPENLQLITAKVLELSPAGAVVRPVDQGKTAGLQKGMEIKGCSLKTGNAILSLTVQIAKANGLFELIFLEGNGDWKEQVQKTIGSCS